MKGEIPVHRIQEKFTTGIFLKRYQEGKATRNGTPEAAVEHVHRDNHYLFYLQEKGENRSLIDFKEYNVTGAGLACVLPGQVHAGGAMDNVSGWLMGIDALFVRDEWKEALETVLVAGNTLVPDPETLDDLKFGFSLLNRKIEAEDHLLARHAATLLTGMIARLYRQRLPGAASKRQATITLQFKSLLDARVKTVKSPARYAAMLHLSPPYLNEAVKNTTGFPASYWIRQAVTLEAKRLLFYTGKSVSEIAFELGYDDHSYFTRLFTKAAGVSPTRFRANYRE